MANERHKFDTSQGIDLAYIYGYINRATDDLEIKFWTRRQASFGFFIINKIYRNIIHSEVPRPVLQKIDFTIVFCIVSELFHTKW